MCLVHPVLRAWRTATRRVRILPFMLAPMTLVVATSAFAQNAPFVIDGIVPANGGTTDPPVTHDPYGSTRELGPVNSSSTKVGVIHSAAPPMLDFTNPNGQVDLRRVWIDTRRAPDGDQWLYFAWERDAKNGSGFVAIEFQKAELDPNCVYTGADVDLVQPQSPGETTLMQACNPWAARTAGDFLLLWDQNGSALDIVKRVFEVSGGQLVLGPPVALGTAVAAIDSTGYYGEAAINLTADVFGGTNSCVNFANIIPGTVTGNSDSADYKDTVLASFPDISNCGTLVVTKVTEPGNATAPLPAGGFGYTVARANGNPVRYAPATTSLADALADGDAATYVDTHVNLIAGADYTVAELPLTEPWAYVSTTCVLREGTPDALEVGSESGTGLTDVVIEPSTTTKCTITNRLMQGTLTVRKIVINDNGGTKTASDFTMFVDLTSGADVSFPGSNGETMTLTAGESFDVTESTVPGYSQVLIEGCKGTIVDDGDSVCTITNDDDAPSLTLVKQVVNDNGGTATAAAWTLSADGPTAFSGPGVCEDATCLEASLANPTTFGDEGFHHGTYTLSESAGPSGYTPSDWVCTGTGVTQNGASVTLALGAAAVCVLVNDDSLTAPTLVTLMSWVLKDTATISGMNPAALPEGESRGKIVFSLFVGPSCSDTPIHVEEVANISSDGSYDTPTGKLVTQADVGNGKTYSWIAHYTGDKFNQPFSTVCGDETHTITIVPQP